MAKLVIWLIWVAHKGEDSMPDANASTKALRALLKDSTIPLKDMAKHIRELTGTNDRLIAIICGSLVEFNLRGLIELPNGADKLFDPTAPLSTFSAKINLAYSLNLIGADIRRNADYIRDIRNVFAHRAAPTSFRTKEVAAVCALLSLGGWEAKISAEKGDAGTRFLNAAVETAKAIMTKRYSPKNSPPASLPEKRPLLRLQTRRYPVGVER